MLATAGCLLTAVACAPGGLVGAAHTSDARQGASNAEEIRLDPASPSALVALLPPGPVRAGLGRVDALLDPTSRTSEQLVVLCNGQVLVSSGSPASVLSARAPVLPTRPANATAFQNSDYAGKVKDYDSHRRVLENSLADRQRGELAIWVGDTRRAMAAVPRVRPAAVPPGQTAPEVAPTSAADAAVVTLRSLTSSGVALGNRQVLLDFSGELPVESVPPSGPDLTGVTVVVPDFQGSAAAQAAATARLLRRGAARVVLLAPGAEDQLVPVVREGLDGAVVEPLAGDVLFGLGSASLQPSAASSLERMLDLLGNRYPTGTAVINGYTDGVGGQVGNQQLSVARAEAVRVWLVGHGVAAERLAVSGHGEQDPIVPGGPNSQPDGRRVVVIITPTQG